MRTTSDDRAGCYLADQLERDLRNDPGSAQHTTLLVWMATEAMERASTLDVRPETRRRLLDLVDEARSRVRAHRLGRTG
ncbi:MAG: hypothetical protein EA379_09310 [Phycisphaerales bacterium]|nr:MAG: hypothetical protein EA379_09310 [Phycisphaerales bacterium]